jgi:pimeloyl-ACP methyl ester carboxylesterase
MGRKNMFNYQAPNPYPKGLPWHQRLLNVLMPEFISNTIGKLASFWQDRKDFKISESEIQRIMQNRHVTLTQGVVKTYDGAILDTLQIVPHTTAKVAIDEQYVIIKFNGNNQIYEDTIDHCAKDAQALRTAIISFNYRGTGNSVKGAKKLRHLVTDGIAQVQRLIDLGVDPKKITLDGISLGAAVATLVAAYYHQRQIRISLWNDRSLASISKAALGMFFPEDIEGLTVGLALVPCRSSTSRILNSVGHWEDNIAKAYMTIADGYKAYLVVAKRNSQQHSQGDGVIYHKASLHYAVKDQEKNHGVRTGNKVYSFRLHGHNLAREALISKDNPNKTAQDLYRDFILRNR